MSLNQLIQQSRYKHLKSLPNWLKFSERLAVQVKTIRNLLGMNQRQLAARSGQQLRSVQRIEGEEVDPRLSSLQKIAHGLDCELLVRLVPRQPFSKMIQVQAELKAQQIIQLSTGTAALEGQQPQQKYVQAQLHNLIKELVEKRPSLLWD